MREVFYCTLVKSNFFISLVCTYLGLIRSGVQKNLVDEMKDPESIIPDRVSDPYSFDTVPIRIRIQGFYDQKLEKKITPEKNLKFFFLYQKLQFTYL